MAVRIMQMSAASRLALAAALACVLWATVWWAM
jgi:hypothetical protein